MKLHENKGVFRQTITAIADRTGYRRDVLEKDYYVICLQYMVFALRTESRIVLDHLTSP